jgi:hypothetical protein
MKRCHVDPENLPTALWTPNILEEFETPEDFELPIPQAIINNLLDLGAYDINRGVNKISEIVETDGDEVEVKVAGGAENSSREAAKVKVKAEGAAPPSFLSAIQSRLNKFRSVYLTRGISR